jgi:dihydroneopterin aldolase
MTSSRAERGPLSRPPRDGAAAAGRPGDVIAISGIRAWGYTGFFDEEQSLGQWFEVDLRIGLDLSLTGEDDQLAHTLNYAEVVQAVTQIVQTCRYRTIERLNTVICDAVLAFPPVLHVHSRLVKVAAPIAGFSGRIAIEMSRTRPQLP